MTCEHFSKVTKYYTGVLRRSEYSESIEGLKVEVAFMVLPRMQYLHLQLLRNPSMYGRISFSIVHLSSITVDPKNLKLYKD